MDEGIKNMDIYAMEIFSIIKQKEILPFAPTWMGFEGIMLSETNRRTQIPYDQNIYVEFKTAKIATNRLMYTENRLVVARHERKGKEGGQNGCEVG